MGVTEASMARIERTPVKCNCGIARPGRTHRFDDPNLVSRAGLVLVMALAERCGLSALVRQNVRITARTGVNADLKAPCLVAGMAAGADSIDDMDVLRHGAMGTLFYGIRAPSTLGLSCARSPGATCGSWSQPGGCS